jgi:membrane-associated PAP2 superfamily phosphatase
MPRTRLHHLVVWTLVALLLLLAWDALGLDLPLARLSGRPHGFPLRDDWLLSDVLHEGVRRLSWGVMIALILAIWWPVGFLRDLTRGERTGLVAGTALALLAVAALKGISRTSCPWDLAEFGGTARYVSHWTFGVIDGGGGRCFPAGHASSGFAFVAGYFWLQNKTPRTARYWLAGVMAAGLGLGLVQQVRGAHYLSHTLWTAWVCWSTAGLAWAAAQGLSARQNRLHGMPETSRISPPGRS